MLGSPPPAIQNRSGSMSLIAPFGSPGPHMGDFYLFFDDPKRHRKNNDFPNLQKLTKMALSIDPLSFKVGFWTKNPPHPA